MKNIMQEDVKFKHERFNMIQCVYGHLSEDASLEAVKNVEGKIRSLFTEIKKAAEKSESFNESHVLEMCVNKAATKQELIVFIHAVCSESRCPAHAFVNMLKGSIDDSEM